MSKDYSHLKTGFIKCKVVAINPDDERYEELNEEPAKGPLTYAYE